MNETEAVNVQFAPPLIPNIATDSTMQLLAFMTTDYDSQANIVYGVVLVRRYYKATHEFIVWRCGTENNGETWEYWNGIYTPDIDRAILHYNRKVGKLLVEATK